VRAADLRIVREFFLGESPFVAQAAQISRGDAGPELLTIVDSWRDTEPDVDVTAS
jgi:hypothetical protein